MGNATLAAMASGKEPGSRGGRLEGRELDRMADVGADELPVSVSKVLRQATRR